MDNKACFQKVVVIGSGRLPYECACSALQYVTDITVLECKVTEGTILEKLCEKSKIPYFCFNKKELREYMMQVTEETLTVSAGSTWIIPKDIIAKPNLRIINWHNALLPAHKGRNAEAWSIFAGDEVTGITWHMLTAGIDSGDIIRAERIRIEEGITALKLFQKQCELGAKVFAEMVESILKGELRPEKQMKTEAEEMHFSWQVPNDGFLDLRWDARKISAFLRSMDYGPLKLLGDMKVVWSGQEYTFSRYKIENCEEEDGEYAEDESLILIRDGKKFILKNVKRKE